MMDIRDDQNHVFNITLAKCTGIYQILDPRTLRFRVKKIYHVFLIFIGLFMCVSSVILSVSVVYYWTDNMPLSIDYIWKGLISLGILLGRHIMELFVDHVLLLYIA